MISFSLRNLFRVLLIIVVLFLFGGCDSGEKSVDKVTGKKDVEEYKHLKKEIEKVADEQVKKYNEVLNGIKEGKEKR